MRNMHLQNLSKILRHAYRTGTQIDTRVSQTSKSGVVSGYDWTCISGLALAGIAAASLVLQAEESHCAAELPLPNANPKADQFVSSFRDWLKDTSCDTTAIAIAPSIQNPEAGLAVYVDEEGLKGKLGGRWWWTRLASWVRPSDFVLASFPLENVVSSTSITADAKLGPLYRQLLDTGMVDERQLVMLFLVVERARGINSAWHPWIGLLPQAFNTPLFYGEAELQQLSGTTLYHATKALKSGLRAQWEGLAEAAQQLLRASGPVTQGLSPTFEDFLWAHSVFWSRSISFPEPVAIPGTKDVAVQAKEGIVPGLDFCNHDVHSKFRWSVWNDGGAKGGTPKAVSLLASDISRVQAGQEVTISYGADKSNEELLHLYGFTVGRNPSDALMIACPVPSPPQRDATFQSRLNILQMRGLSPRLFLTAADLAKEAEPSNSLGSDDSVWEVLEVLTMEESQVAAAERSIADLSPEAAERFRLHVVSPDQVKSSARRLAQLATLRMLLERKCQQMEGSNGTGSLEVDVALLEADADMPPLQRSCVVYRASQKRLARGYLERVRRAEEDERSILSAAQEQTALPAAALHPDPEL